MNEELEKKDVNDAEEDIRENEEETHDVSNDEVRDDLQEDNRETEESIEDLKKQIEILTIENAKLRKERDEAHDAFLSTGKNVEEEEEKTYESMKGDIK